MAATPLVSVRRPNPVPRPEMRDTYVADNDTDDREVTSDAEEGDEGRGYGGHPEACDQPEH